MTRFTFRLQRLLELREQREQAVARSLADARRSAEAARAARGALQAVRAANAEQLMSAHSAGRTVGDVRQLGYVLDQLDHRIDAAATTVATAEGVVRHAQGALTDAFRERRVLDRLRERHLDVWRATSVQLDRQLMDDIALARFTRPSADPSERQ
jgi:flagellar FliJ protein